MCVLTGAVGFSCTCCMLCVSVWAFVPVAGVTEETGSSYTVCVYYLVWLCVCAIQHQAVAELCESVCRSLRGDPLCIKSLLPLVCSEPTVKCPAVKALCVLACAHQVFSSE